MKTSNARTGGLLRKRPRLRPGFTVLEITLAIGILMSAIVLTAQLGVWGLEQRAQAADSQEALELAANILESARATPWDALTPDWAATQKLPDSLAQRLNDGKLTVRVEPETGRPQTKRISVDIHWKQSNGNDARPIRLVGLISSRSAPVTGGKP